MILGIIIMKDMVRGLVSSNFEAAREKRGSVVCTFIHYLTIMNIGANLGQNSRIWANAGQKRDRKSVV